jgi:hypothetical protein
VKQRILKAEKEGGGNKNSWLLTLACGHVIPMQTHKRQLDQGEGTKVWCWKCKKGRG